VCGIISDFFCPFYLAPAHLARIPQFKSDDTTPLVTGFQATSEKPSPFTDVYSDPLFNNGHGERTFVNNIGVASDYHPAMLPEDFFKSDIVCFGGTALVPVIHNNLTRLLKRAGRIIVQRLSIQFLISGMKRPALENHGLSLMMTTASP
jgi:hypothetical protein